MVDIETIKPEIQDTHRLGKATIAYSPVMDNMLNPLYSPPTNKAVISGYYNPTSKLFDYHDTIKICRWFYTFDPIAGTVIERMADMSVTEVRNRRKGKRNAEMVDDVTLSYFNAVAKRIRPLLKLIALEYFIHGLAVPDYTLERVRGDILSEQLGRKRIWVPTKGWVRNPENIVLKRKPVGMDRTAFIKIPVEDIQFIKTGGYYSDGNYDPKGYAYIVETFPEYVAAIKAGQTTLLLENVRPILRKANSYSDYPTPFLTKAIKALQHKEAVKQMDRSIANRAIEALRHIKVGDKDYPADDDDLARAKLVVEQGNSTSERVYNLITPHTYDISWSIPPLDALLSPVKYDEPNADIFLGLGFPRILTVGETLRSNASDSKIASLGPKATLEDLRDNIIMWVEDLYRELADKNGFTSIPEPYFTPIQTMDYTALVQFAVDAMNSGSISKNDVAQLYGTDYDTVASQIETERSLGVPSPTELAAQTAVDAQQKAQEIQAANQSKQQQVDNNNNNSAGDKTKTPA
jgi:hypothetical protein